MILSLLRSAQSSRRSRLAETCLDALFAIAAGRRDDSDGDGDDVDINLDRAGEDDEGDMHAVGHHRNAAAVHAYNVIKAILRDESVSKCCSDKLSAAYELAFDGFVSAVFAIRNAAMMLFSSLQTRLLGSSGAGGGATASELNVFSATTTVATATAPASLAFCSPQQSTGELSKAGTDVGGAASGATDVSQTSTLASAGRVLTLKAVATAHPRLMSLILATLGQARSTRSRPRTPAGDTDGNSTCGPSASANKQGYLALVFLAGLDNRSAVPDGDTGSSAGALAAEVCDLLHLWAQSSDARVRRLAARAVSACVPLSLAPCVAEGVIQRIRTRVQAPRSWSCTDKAGLEVEETVEGEKCGQAAAHSQAHVRWNTVHGLLLQLAALATTHARAFGSDSRILASCLSSELMSALSPQVAGLPTSQGQQGEVAVPYVVQASYWHVVSAVLNTVAAQVPPGCVENATSQQQPPEETNSNSTSTSHSASVVREVHGAVGAVCAGARDRVRHLISSSGGGHLHIGQPGWGEYRCALARAVFEARGALEALQCGSSTGSGGTGSDGAEWAQLFCGCLENDEMGLGVLEYFSSGAGMLESPKLFSAAAHALHDIHARGPDAVVSLLACLSKPLGSGTRFAQTLMASRDAAGSNADEEGVVHVLIGVVAASADLARASTFDAVRFGAVALCGRAMLWLCRLTLQQQRHEGGATLLGGDDCLRLYLQALTSFTAQVPSANTALAVLEGMCALPAMAQLQMLSHARSSQARTTASRLGPAVQQEAVSAFALLLQLLFHDEPAASERAAALVSECWQCVVVEAQPPSRALPHSNAGAAQSLGALASASRLLLLVCEALWQGDTPASAACASPPSPPPPPPPPSTPPQQQRQQLVEALASYLKAEALESGLCELAAIAVEQTATSADELLFLHNEAFPLFPVVDVLALLLRPRACPTPCSPLAGEAGGRLAPLFSLAALCGVGQEQARALEERTACGVHGGLGVGDKQGAAFVLEGMDVARVEGQSVAGRTSVTAALCLRMLDATK